MQNEKRPLFLLSGPVKNGLRLVGVLLLTIFAMGAFAYSVVYVLPFIVAFLISLTLEPAVKLLQKIPKIKRGLATGIVVALVMSVLLFLLILFISKIWVQAKDFALTLPSNINLWTSQLNGIVDQWQESTDLLQPETAAFISQIIQDLRMNLLSTLNSVTRVLWNTAVSLPRIFVFSMVLLLSTFFITKDRYRIRDYFIEQMPTAWMKKLNSLRLDTVLSVLGYFRSQLIIMCITFSEVFVGLTVLNVSYALLLSLFIAFLDVLPVIGPSIVLFPWSAYSFFMGDIMLGVGLLLLYGIIWISRNMIEPRVLSAQIGMYPLLTLLSIYVGLNYMGFLGMIVGPFSLMLIRSVFRMYLNGQPLGDFIMHGHKETDENKE